MDHSETTYLMDRQGRYADCAAYQEDHAKRRISIKLSVISRSVALRYARLQPFDLDQSQGGA